MKKRRENYLYVDFKLLLSKEPEPDSLKLKNLSSVEK